MKRSSRRLTNLAAHQRPRRTALRRNPHRPLHPAFRKARRQKRRKKYQTAVLRPILPRLRNLRMLPRAQAEPDRKKIIAVQRQSRRQKKHRKNLRWSFVRRYCVRNMTPMRKNTALRWKCRSTRVYFPRRPQSFQSRTRFCPRAKNISQSSARSPIHMWMKTGRNIPSTTHSLWRTKRCADL